MRNGSPGPAGLLFRCAHSANYRKGKLPKCRQRKAIDMIFSFYGRDRIDGHKRIQLVKFRRKLARHNFLCIFGF